MPTKTRNSGRASSSVSVLNHHFEAGTEVVMMSCKVVKINKYNWHQERCMIITQDNIYNFKSKSKVFSLIANRGEANH